MLGSRGKTCHFTHYGVCDPNNPKKIRVVFNLSVEYYGGCPNRYFNLDHN